MDQSKQIDQIADALAQAQARILDATKGANNPFIGNKYASLTDVSNACRKELTDNGLSITQTCPPPTEIPPGMITVITTLRHKSGQWIRGYLTMPIVKKAKGEAEGHASNDPQAFGGILTYCRRYALAAMCWVAPDEDDTDAEPRKQPPRPPPAKAQERPATATPPAHAYADGPADMEEPPPHDDIPFGHDDGQDVDPAPAWTPTDKQKGLLKALSRKVGLDGDAWHAFLVAEAGVDSSTKLDKAGFDRVVEAMKAADKDGKKIVPLVGFRSYIPPHAAPATLPLTDQPSERERTKMAIQEWIDGPAGKEKMDKVRTMLKIGAQDMNLMALDELRAVLAELRKLK